VQDSLPQIVCLFSLIVAWQRVACPPCNAQGVRNTRDFGGADAVKILIYYTPFEDAKVNDIKHAFIERIGAECVTNDILFFLEFVG